MIRYDNIKTHLGSQIHFWGRVKATIAQSTVKFPIVMRFISAHVYLLSFNDQTSRKQNVLFLYSYSKLTFCIEYDICWQNAESDPC